MPGVCPPPTALPQRDLFARSASSSLDEAWHLLTDKNPFPARRREERIAVIGAGPAGLSCAYQLARRGYPVTVYEAAAEPGGMLRYGIPPYRLPKDVLAGEVRNILALGVELACGTKVGVDLPYAQLRSRFAAIYVALGAQRALRLDIAGEASAGVINAVDFLRRISSGERPEIGGQVVVVGGGNTAVDAARASRRLGARATVLYRRTRDEMPAVASEVAAAEGEGVSFTFLAAPTRIGAAGTGPLRLACLRMQAGPLEPGGRHRPVPIPGSTFTLEADTVIAAVGQEADLSGLEQAAEREGWLHASAGTPVATAAGVFLGGDLVRKDFAVAAVGAGRRAAVAIEAYLNAFGFRDPEAPRPVRSAEVQLEYYQTTPRHEERELAPAARSTSFAEVNLGLPPADALEEAARCMSCGLCFACDRCRIFCPVQDIGLDKRRPPGQVMFTDYTRCTGCEVCARICPCHYIEMGLDWTGLPLSS